MNGDIDYSKRDHARQTAEQIARNTAAAHAIVHACHDIMAETLVFDGLTDKKEKLVNKLQEKIIEILELIERIEE